MAKKQQFRECKLCGQTKKLTFEHVPPESAFNSQSIKKISFDESIKVMTGHEGRMPWDFEGLKGKIDQKGMGDYYLCEECNNNTGSWYISEYAKFAHTLNEMIHVENFTPRKRYSFELQDVHPLRIFKAAMVMFCDINNGCFGDERIRKFLLNKESTDFPGDKYQIYMCLISPGMQRIQNLAVMHLSGIGLVTISEISYYPLGFSLYIDKPEGYTPPGLLINDFATRLYNEKGNIIFQGVPYLEVNSLIPDDFRSKEEFHKILNSELQF